MLPTLDCSPLSTVHDADHSVFDWFLDLEGSYVCIDVGPIPPTDSADPRGHFTWACAEELTALIDSVVVDFVNALEAKFMPGAIAVFRSVRTDGSTHASFVVPHYRLRQATDIQRVFVEIWGRAFPSYPPRCERLNYSDRYRLLDDYFYAPEPDAGDSYFVICGAQFPAWCDDELDFLGPRAVPKYEAHAA